MKFIKNIVIFIEIMILSILAGGVLVSGMYTMILKSESIEPRFLKTKR